MPYGHGLKACQGHHAGFARQQVPDNPLDRAVVVGSISSLDDNEDLFPVSMTWRCSFTNSTCAAFKPLLPPSIVTPRNGDVGFAVVGEYGDNCVVLRHGGSLFEWMLRRCAALRRRNRGDSVRAKVCSFGHDAESAVA